MASKYDNPNEVCTHKASLDISDYEKYRELEIQSILKYDILTAFLGCVRNKTSPGKDSEREWHRCPQCNLIGKLLAIFSISSISSCSK